MPRFLHDIRLIVQLAICVLFSTAAGQAGAAEMVTHSIFNPSTTPQRDARQGRLSLAGGKGGGPKGEKNGAYRTGRYTGEAKAERQAARALIRERRRLIDVGD